MELNFITDENMELVKLWAVNVFVAVLIIIDRKSVV